MSCKISKRVGTTRRKIKEIEVHSEYHGLFISKSLRSLKKL